jgi:hypothetical protein
MSRRVLASASSQRKSRFEQTAYAVRAGIEKWRPKRSAPRNPGEERALLHSEHSQNDCGRAAEIARPRLSIGIQFP